MLVIVGCFTLCSSSAYEHHQALFYLLNLKGWIHRDVSAANILDVDGNGVLHDFEYITDMPKKYGLTVEGPFYKIPFTVVSSNSGDTSVFLKECLGNRTFHVRRSNS